MHTPAREPEHVSVSVPGTVAVLVLSVPGTVAVLGPKKQFKLFEESPVLSCSGRSGSFFWVALGGVGGGGKPWVQRFYSNPCEGPENALLKFVELVPGGP